MFDIEPLKNSTVIALLGFLAFGKVLLGLAFDQFLNLPSVRQHRVFRVPIPPGQALREMTTSWHVVSDAVALALLMTTHLMRFGATTPLSFVGTFVVFYVWVETYYYFGHLLMHRFKFLYRFHRTHHITKVVTPLSSISMSLFERTFLYTGGWLAFMSLVSWIWPLSLAGVAAYYTFHFVISLHGHSNTEESSHGLLLTKVGMGSATFHAVHHARTHVNYGFSCTLWDRLLRTYDPETFALQERAMAGDGARELRPRAFARSEAALASPPQA